MPWRYAWTRSPQPDSLHPFLTFPHVPLLRIMLRLYITTPLCRSFLRYTQCHTAVCFQTRRRVRLQCWEFDWDANGNLMIRTISTNAPRHHIHTLLRPGMTAAEMNRNGTRLKDIAAEIDDDVIKLVSKPNRMDDNFNLRRLVNSVPGSRSGYKPIIAHNTGAEGQVSRTQHGTSSPVAT
ncbi:hypothetical protein K439DRAFT_81528 [Ramaria rubella]|nr:hypothetical protein K439DRAFT_81528 [Ramaria rubella]